MRTQVLAAKVRTRTTGRIVLVVTDRLAHAVAVGQGVRVALPRDRATRRTIVLRRVAGEWRVAQVRAQAEPGGEHGGHVAVAEPVAGLLQGGGAHVERAEQLGRHLTGGRPSAAPSGRRRARDGAAPPPAPA